MVIWVNECMYSFCTTPRRKRHLTTNELSEAFCEIRARVANLL